MHLPTDQRAEALSRLYQAAEAQLVALVQQALTSGALGTARYRQERLAAVRQRLAELQQKAIPEATQLLTDSYVLGGRIAEVGGGFAGARVTGGFGTGFHEQAIDVIADNLTGELNDAAERVGRQVDDVFRREGLRQSALALIEGASRRDASQRLAGALRAQGVNAFQDRSGREWGLATYARMAVRTTTREAVTRGTTNRLLEGGRDLVEVALHDAACPRCVAAYKGRTFSLTGATEGYDVLTEPPPLHPNDRCNVIPSGANLDALERELGLQPAEAIPA